MAIEKLDWPALLSVSVNSTLGLLAVSGTSTIDLRSITQSGAAVTAANSKAKYMYSAASIKHVDISLWSAGDSVTIANNVLVPVGKGNDTLIGWPGNRPIESRNGPNSLTAEPVTTRSMAALVLTTLSLVNLVFRWRPFPNPSASMAEPAMRRLT